MVDYIPQPGTKNLATDLLLGGHFQVRVLDNSSTLIMS